MGLLFKPPVCESLLQLPEGAASASETSRGQHTLPPLLGTQPLLDRKAPSGTLGQTRNRERLYVRFHKSKNYLMIQRALYIQPITTESRQGERRVSPHRQATGLKVTLKATQAWLLAHSCSAHACLSPSQGNAPGCQRLHSCEEAALA